MERFSKLFIFLALVILSFPVFAQQYEIACEKSGGKMKSWAPDKLNPEGGTACYCGSEAFLPSSDEVCKNEKLVDKKSGLSRKEFQEKNAVFPVWKQEACKRSAGTIKSNQCLCNGISFDPDDHMLCHANQIIGTADLSTEHAGLCKKAGGWPSAAYTMTCECVAGRFHYPNQKCVDDKQISWIGKSIKISGRIGVAPDEFDPNGYKCDSKNIADAVSYDGVDYCAMDASCFRLSDGKFVPFSDGFYDLVCNTTKVDGKQLCTGPSKCLNSGSPASDISDAISSYLKLASSGNPPQQKKSGGAR